MNKQRQFWVGRIEAAWKRRSIVWLTGVRRVGKTTLTHMLPNCAYFNCDLPSVGDRLADPELFLKAQSSGARIILDEIHRLPDPSRLLKIAADEFPALRIVATGSSTLSATRKFRDSLTGRKESVFLPPVLWEECRTESFPAALDRRLLHGGLPENLMVEPLNQGWYAEWLDSYYARDIQELFAIRNRDAFLRLLRLALCQSGGLLDYSKWAELAEISRPTVKAHVEAMVISHTLALLAPFHGGGSRELVKQPKCYAFDTGFVAFARGWDSLRKEDYGVLWEHLVLDALRAALPDVSPCYWRDKSGREIDFVVPRSRGQVGAIECKIQPDRLEADALTVFRSLYPKGTNYLVSPHTDIAYPKRIRNLLVDVVPLATLYR